MDSTVCRFLRQQPRLSTIRHSAHTHLRRDGGVTTVSVSTYSEGSKCILVRDLGAVPELLAFMRDAEIRTNHKALVTLLVALAGDGFDAEALAAILIDAISHYWLLRDVFGGEHPLAISEDRYLTTLAALATALMKEKK